MPSPVSMPPNIMTAAFDTTSPGLSVAVASARTPPPCSIVLETWRPSVSHGGLRAGTDLAADRDAIDGGDDLVVPAQDRRRLGVEQVERRSDHLDRQRTGQIAADLGAATRCERWRPATCGVLGRVS